jgi:hypothetical protein
MPKTGALAHLAKFSTVFKAVGDRESVRHQPADGRPETPVPVGPSFEEG